MLGAFDCEEGRNFNLPQKMKWTTHSSKIVTKKKDDYFSLKNKQSSQSKLLG